MNILHLRQVKEEEEEEKLKVSFLISNFRIPLSKSCQKKEQKKFFLEIMNCSILDINFFPTRFGMAVFESFIHSQYFGGLGEGLYL